MCLKFSKINCSVRICDRLFFHNQWGIRENGYKSSRWKVFTTDWFLKIISTLISPLQAKYFTKRLLDSLEYICVCPRIKREVVYIRKTVLWFDEVYGLKTTTCILRLLRHHFLVIELPQLRPLYLSDLLLVYAKIEFDCSKEIVTCKTNLRYVHKIL